MKITTKNFSIFELRKTLCRDGVYQATRAAVRKVIASGDDLPIRLYQKDWVSYLESVSVSTSFSHGVLRLGCHTFNRVNTRKILRWAGVKA